MINDSTNIRSYEELSKNKELLKKVIRIAQYESELDMGVNPSNFEQADTGNLTEKDFEYIKKISVLVEEKLKDFAWLSNTLSEIDSSSVAKRNSFRGLRFDDELFKVGRGILESFLQEKYKG